MNQTTVFHIFVRRSERMRNAKYTVKPITRNVVDLREKKYSCSVMTETGLRSTKRKQGILFAQSKIGMLWLKEHWNCTGGKCFDNVYACDAGSSDSRPSFYRFCRSAGADQTDFSERSELCRRPGRAQCPGTVTGERFLLAADGLSEGNGRRLWPHFLGGMLAELKKFPWIALAVSVRICATS